MISGYFREVELRLKNAEIIADKSVDLREFSATEGMHVSSFPHHKHLPINVVESDEKGIMDILDEIEILILGTGQELRI